MIVVSSKKLPHNLLKARGIAYVWKVWAYITSHRYGKPGLPRSSRLLINRVGYKVLERYFHKCAAGAML
jgi:hypothetical protein